MEIAGKKETMESEHFNNVLLKLTTREQRIQRAAAEELPLRQIFDDVCREAPTKAAEQVSFANSDTRFALVPCGRPPALLSWLCGAS